jgi:hypothetical protein
MASLPATAPEGPIKNPQQIIPEERDEEDNDDRSAPQTKAKKDGSGEEHGNVVKAAAGGAACASSEDEDEDERECRVCRCPAEPGRKLFSPCLCSGSIELCHQDCLLQWLKHSNKDHCELCGHKFEFTPVYAEDAPVQLPLARVCQTLLRRVATEWLPFGGRVLLALFLWLFVVPLNTSWLYRIWIHRSRVFIERLTLAYVRARVFHLLLLLFF